MTAVSALQDASDGNSAAIRCKPAGTPADTDTGTLSDVPPLFNLHGHVALITGANHGIGAATAKALADPRREPRRSGRDSCFSGL
jgi:hypothetical protein